MLEEAHLKLTKPGPDQQSPSTDLQTHNSQHNSHSQVCGTDILLSVVIWLPDLANKYTIIDVQLNLNYF